MLPNFILLAVAAGPAAVPPEPNKAASTIVVEGQRDDSSAAQRLSSASGATVDGAELERRRAPTLGETVSRVPGVQNDYFGPAVGRPTIRGQTGGRVAILVDGLPTQDASGIGAEHAAAVEPFLADRIELLRGSAAVPYGGGAIGGVVNVIDGRIPTQRHGGGPTGRAEVRSGDNVGVTSMTRLDGGRGAFAWHLDGLYRYQGDQAIPGLAKADTCRTWSSLVSNTGLQALCQVRLARPTYVYDATVKRYVDATPLSGQIITNLDPTGDADGRLPNSAIRTTAVTAGGSIIVDGGFLGLSIGRYDNSYGVPGFALITSSRTGASPIGVTVGQTRFDLKGALYDPLPGVATVTLRAAHVRSRDRERVPDRDWSRFDGSGDEMRVEITHRPLGPLSGSIGGQIADRTLRTAETTSYLPSVATAERSAFLAEQLILSPLTLSGGIRYDRVRYDLDEASVRAGRGQGAAYARDADFHLLSGDVGARLALFSSLYLRGRWSHAERAPGINELYANGNHFSILTEEQGDARLRKERAETVEVGGGIDTSWLSASVSAYSTKFVDYIYLGNTGVSRTLPVREWRQGDTRFRGIEGEATFRATTRVGRFALHGFGDYVQVHPIFTLPDGYSPFDSGSTAALDRQYYRQRLDGDYLPRTPMSRYGGDLDWESGAWRASIGAVRYLRQADVAKGEPISNGFTLVDAHVAYSFGTAARYEAFVDVANLTNAEARLHNSFLRLRAPLPGRAVAVGLRAAF
ncbi:TonB-dependent receptor [Sphingomonas sp. S6]|jgi:iron complex outermembrane receptor protein|uniref:TonB-dependent receptor n=1 Tax=Sphingomonas sp. S6 TaxID=3368600 RepID=UPI000FA6D9C5|nr:TonB-dependent receptor [uncultured Sphingomonas sp.]RTL18480.1 MAG: TonB-dependent receptor [Sphingomonadaceae bacterium]